MRYLAKDGAGRTVGSGRTIITAVKWAKKRDGVYVVDDETGAIQWRKPQAAKPLTDDEIVDGFDPEAGTKLTRSMKKAAKPKAAPSPLPWRTTEARPIGRTEPGYRVIIQGPEGTRAPAKAYGTTKESAEANAALIVKAVNSHAALVDMARRAESGAVMNLEELDALTAASGTEDYQEIRSYLVSVRDEARAALRADGEGV